LNPAAVDDPYDYNRDRRVDVSDENLTRVFRSNFLTALRLIDLTSLAPLSQTVSGPLAKSSVASQSSPGSLSEPMPSGNSSLKLSITLIGDGSLRLEPSGADLTSVRIHTTTNITAGPWENLPSGPELAPGVPSSPRLPLEKSTTPRFFRAVRD
jgi:hypothetical protein